jgi:drug/metabolite transporter (DMT)-like permease
MSSRPHPHHQYACGRSPKDVFLPSRIPVNTSYAIAVAFAYSLVSIFARLAYDGGSNVLTVVTARALFVLLALWAYLAWRGTPWRLPAKERNVSLALGVLLALSNFLLNQAIVRLPVSNALLIFYTFPVLLSIVSWMSGKDKPTLRIAAALVLSLIGLALTLQVKGGPLDPLGLAYAVAAAASWGGLMYLSGRVLGSRKSQVHTLHMIMTATGIFALACILTGDVVFPATGRGWVGFVGAPLAYFVAIVGTMTAISVLGAVRTGFFMNFEAVGVILFAALILEQYMNGLQLVGAALVIVSMFVFNAPPRPASKN